MRTRYTNQFKAQVVQEILKEEKTLNQLAAEHSVHPNQLKPLEGDRAGRLA
jgi:putative transposase